MTKSPTVRLPFCTPIAAITMTATSPRLMISAWPKFSMASEVAVFTAASS